MRRLPRAITYPIAAVAVAANIISILVFIKEENPRDYIHAFFALFKKSPRELSKLEFIQLPGMNVSMGKTEVTVKAYRACVKKRVCKMPEGPDCNSSKGDAFAKHPMNCIDAHAARSFCHWIGGRLPTSDEWMHAAIRGKTQIFPWGNELPTPTLANYREAWATKANSFESAEGTFPVGSFSPAGDSPDGLQDMVGNLSEWTSEGLLKGGSFCSPASSLTVFHTSEQDCPRSLEASAGFRCIIDIP